MLLFAFVAFTGERRNVCRKLFIYMCDMLPCELAAGFTLKLTQQREKGNEMFSGSARCKIVTAGVGSPLEGRTQEELLV